MTQYKIKFASTSVPPVCGTGNLTIDLIDGYPYANNNPIREIFVYFDETETGDYELTCLDGVVDDHVIHASVAATQDSARTWASAGGCRWERTSGGDLLLKFTPPEVGRNGATALWEFGVNTPELHLKVKVKRQEGVNSGSCSGWPE
jgi:hypothetical protein